MMKSCAGRFPMPALVPFLFSIFPCRELQDVAAQILVLDDVRKLLGYIGGVNLHVFLLEVGRFERDFVQNFFEDGVESASANVFGLLIHVSAKRATAATASSVMLSLTPSVSNSATYCLMSAFLGSVRIRIK